MKRGEIFFANVDPTIGSEIKNKRPVLIISNDANNQASDLVTVLPLTSNIKKIFPFEVMLAAKVSGLKKDSKVQCHQIRTISKLRLGKSAVGKVDKNILYKIQEALELHLDF